MMELLLNLLALLGLGSLFLNLTLPTSLLVQRTASFDHKHEGIGRILRGVSTSQDSHKTQASLAVHQWHRQCGFGSLRELIQSSLFPKYPDDIIRINESRISSTGRNIGVRISGYLHVPETGFYMFQLTSTGESDFWFSTAHNSLQRIVKAIHDSRATISTPSDSHCSSEMYLHTERVYAFEVFHVGNLVEVRWLRPGSQRFTAIESQHLSHDTKSLAHEVLMFSNKESINDAKESYIPFYFVAFLTEWIKNSAIPRCVFDLKDNVDKLKRKTSSNHLKTNAMTLYSDVNGTKRNSWKENAEVKHIVDLYMRGLESIFPK